jgi:hypothetical protein
MDLTLKQLIEKVDSIHRDLDRLYEAPQLKQNLTELKQLAYATQFVHNKILNIYEIYNNKYKIAKLRHRGVLNHINQTNIGKTNIGKTNVIGMPLAPNIATDAKIINSIKELPNTPMYWVADIEQYAFKINGVIFRGNIGNIYNKNDIVKSTQLTKNDNKKITQMTICKYKNKCRTVLNGGLCEFYHDPIELMDLVEEKLLTYKVYKMYLKMHRNFSNTSWIHTTTPQHKHNVSFRHFGSRDILKHELDLIKFEPSQADVMGIDNFRQQCMHDILVIMGLKEHALLPDVDSITNMQPRQLAKKYNDTENPFSSLAQ